MKFEEQRLSGLFVIHLEPISDERGSFLRTFCSETFIERGLVDCSSQCSLSRTSSRGTLRGLHFQTAPFEETKLVRCTRGSIWDVVVDLRPTSPTRGQWYGTALNADDNLSLYIPRGFAHGFITMEDNCEVFYQMGEPYVRSAARGIRWDDEELAIKWPIVPSTISDADQKLPYLRDLEDL